MIDYISVILPTYNPDPLKLAASLECLRAQTLSKDQWELIIVDNNSDQPVTSDLIWHTNAIVIREIKPGLTNARLAGFKKSKGSIIVMVDDDNLLFNDYLDNTMKIFNDNVKMGAIGGKSLPLFETVPPGWLREFYSCLALRDFGDEILTAEWNNEYPIAAPIGAGMAIRKAALKPYLNKQHIILDRIGNDLSSGGDNDIVIEILKEGWQVGYYPALNLHHMISKKRTTKEYISKLLNNTNRSWVQLLKIHRISPWKTIPRWTVPLRKLKAWFTYGAWMNSTRSIKWNGACGHFDGLADD
ncbi:glycosyltransferase family 2 protein [Pedobacter frigidisoli]|uniref:Glycosyltransferase family 2 protein n=1 Tax=Pedobacter frigidisoli TaxID=2530455 RepID=A0A4R0NZU9_9SPHI|nr:glycosyltransferase [Pedobacter frigidisoli]TCD07725.1 glycosyltransferase family 2 protein [Pedobacter frigidisoli]